MLSKKNQRGQQIADDQRIIRFVVTTIFAAIGTIILGFIFLRSAVFEMNISASQFITFGIIGGVIFSTFRFLSKRQAAIAILLLFVLDMLLQHSTVWRLVLRDILCYLGFIIALFIFTYYYFDKLRQVVIGRILVLSSVIALNYVIITGILYSVFRVSAEKFDLNLLQMVYFNLAQGFLIGLGLGTGIEVAEYFYELKNKSK